MPLGRLSRRGRRSRGIATGWEGCGYKNALGQENGWNYDPLGNWNQPSGTGYVTKVTGTTILTQNRACSIATGIPPSTGRSAQRALCSEQPYRRCYPG